MSATKRYSYRRLKEPPSQGDPYKMVERWYFPISDRQAPGMDSVIGFFYDEPRANLVVNLLNNDHDRRTRVKPVK